MDLSSLLSRSASEVKAPPLVPPGTWLFRVMGTDSTKTVPASGNGIVSFAVQAEAPVEVDPAALVGVTLPVKMKKDFIITEASLFYLKNFLTGTLGYPDDSTPMQQMIDNSIGRPFKGIIVHTPDRKDPTIMRADIRDTMAA